MEEKQVFLLSYDLQWFADGPGGEKTEPATDKRLREARDDGKVVKSKELSAAAEMIVLFLVLRYSMSALGSGLIGSFSLFYNEIPDILTDNKGAFTSQTAGLLLQQTIIQMLQLLAPFLIAGFVVCFVVSVFQLRGIHVTTKPMQPKLEKFNPINGFKRIFSKDSLFELAKSILKVVIIIVVAYYSIRDYEGELLILYGMELTPAILLIGNIILDTAIRIAAVYLIIGIVDWIYQKRKFDTDMKMTKQEVKDEYKNTEGSPEIKGKQRQRMREASQRRMMQELPNADVIITNPTHLSVAIKYDDRVSKAPIVLAKGEDYLALKIREIAKEHDIQIMENKPLARMLYANVDIGQEVPPELYQAVAEVLASVYKMKNLI